MRRTFEPYRTSVHSQNGEDGVVREILRRIGLPAGPGFCVDVGAADGETYSNVRALLDQGWDGILVDNNADNIDLLLLLARDLPGCVQVIRRTMGPGLRDRLDALLLETHAPKRFDVLSIDVDSHDLQIWRDMRLYEPAVVIVEVNSAIPLGVKQVHSAESPGASFTSMLEVGQRKGYVLACHTGNMIFVDGRYADRLGLTAEEREHPERLFNYGGPPLA